MEQQKPLNEMLQEKQRIYLEEILSTAFDFSLLSRQLENLQKYKTDQMEFEDESMQQAMGVLLKRFRDEAGNTTTFRRQLQRLLQQNNPEMLLERIAKGSLYYATFMEENLKQLLFHLAEVERLTRSKTYRNTLSEMDQQIMICWGKLEQAEHLAGSILSDLKIIKTEAAYRARIKRRSELWEMAQTAAEENPKLTTRLTGRKRKKGVPLKTGETYKITYSLIKEGKSIEEIASKRKLGISTIEGHVARGIQDGAIDISEVLSEETIQEVARIMQETKESIGELHNSQNGKYTYGLLRMVHAYLERKPL